MPSSAAPERLADEQIADFAAALRPRLSSPAALRTDRLHRALYATDASMYEQAPLGVLTPRTREDVQAAVEAAAQFGLPILPRGSGSSLAGSAVGAALVIDAARHLDRVLAVDPEAKTATVEPGVVLDGLNARLAQHGLQVGPDPASSNRATLGGMIGTNATGAHSIRYGSVVDHLVSAEMALDDGMLARFAALDGAGWTAKTRLSGREGDLYRALDGLLAAHADAIRQDTPRHWRRAGGYRLERLLAPEHRAGVDFGPAAPHLDGSRNAAHLLCGSEGTMGVITEATIGLVDRPAKTALGIAHFSTRRAALEAVGEVLALGPSAVELFDAEALTRARQIVEYAPKLGFVQADRFPRMPDLLVIEFEGESEAELVHHLDRLERALGPQGVLTRCLLGAEMADVWHVRKAGLGLAMSARLPVQAAAFIEDAAVPVEHLPDYIGRLEAAMAEHGVTAVVYAHASAGCLHVRPFIDLKTAGGVRTMERVAQASAGLVRAYGGALASEHGDGLARSWLAPQFYGTPLYSAYVEAKRAFDPSGRMNPGKVVEAPPMTQDLRLGPDYAPREVISDLTFLDANGRDIGFAETVEACNGQGVCLKRSDSGGVMCPPFMATREEKDSTRGRANALRHALQGRLALDGPEVADAMDLCVSCKACKAECPAQVDLAKLKAAWLHETHKTTPPSPRTRLFAHLPAFAQKIAGPLAAAANAAAKSPASRPALRALGIVTDKPLPTFARHPFYEKEVGLPEPGKPHVVLYADTFARYLEPEIPRAAVQVMEAAGFGVGVPPYRCCGRTLLSKGFLDEAKAKAAALVEQLGPHAMAGAEIVGLEPSCILTLRDEVPAFFPDSPQAAALARQAMTFEEWTVRHAGRLRDLPWRPEWAGRPALAHAHCHQKALSETALSVEALALAGLDAREAGAGCCGVAGAFGYEAEHAEVSRQMAEDRLAPAVRAQPTGAVVVAAGTSCRAQIADATGRRALHPAEALAQALSAREQNGYLVGAREQSGQKR